MSIASHFIASLCNRWFSLTWPASMQICENKKIVCIRKESNPTGFVWNTNIVAVSLFWNFNMAAVTSCENPLWSLLETRKLAILVKMRLPV